MPPYDQLSCKICDIPPSEICNECNSGICNRPDCSMLISTYNNKKIQYNNILYVTIVLLVFQQNFNK